MDSPIFEQLWPAQTTKPARYFRFKINAILNIGIDWHFAIVVASQASNVLSMVSIIIKFDMNLGAGLSAKTFWKHNMGNFLFCYQAQQYRLSKHSTWISGSINRQEWIRWEADDLNCICNFIFWYRMTFQTNSCSWHTIERQRVFLKVVSSHVGWW